MTNSISSLIFDSLDARDIELVEAARDVLSRRYRPFWHVVGCAIRDSSGKIHVGVHLEGNIGRTAICAEAVALGSLVTSGGGKIDTIVAVQYIPGETGQPATLPIVSPCGICREMISDYAPRASVITCHPVEADTAVKLQIEALLPMKYRGADAPDTSPI